MPAYRKISGGLNSVFKKGSGVLSSVFRKGGALIDHVSHGLSGVSRGLATVGRVGGQLINSPAADALAGGFGPEGLAALAGARRLLGGINRGSEVAQKLSHLSNRGSYKSKDSLENLKDARERAEGIKSSFV